MSNRTIADYVAMKKCMLDDDVRAGRVFPSEAERIREILTEMGLSRPVRKAPRDISWGRL